MSNSQYPVPAWMFGALQNVESGGDPNALSPAGAAGKNQIMPSTALDPGYGVQPLQNWNGVDPRTAPQVEQDRFANDYLNAMVQHNGGNVQQGLMAYNGGPGRVDNWKADQGTLPQETADYPGKVLSQGTQYAQNTTQANDATAGPSKLDLMLEAESRGILPPDKLELLQEARSRGLIAGGQPQQSQQPEQSYSDRRHSIADSGFSQMGSSFNNLMADHTNDTEYSPLTDMMGMAGGLTNAFMAPITAGVEGGIRPLAKMVSGPQTQAEMAKGDYSKADKLSQDLVNAGTLAIPFLPKEGVEPPNIGGPWNGQPLLNAEPGTLKSMMSDSSGLGGITSDQLTAENTIPSATSMRDVARQSYEAAGTQSGLLTPDMATDFVSSINKIRPQQERVAALEGDTEASKLINGLQGWAGKPISFEEADELDKLITKKMNMPSAVDKVTGHLTAEGNDLLEIQQSLRETMDKGGNGFDTLGIARKQWAASMRQQQLENIIECAQLADVPATAIKNGFKALYTNKVRLRGYNSEEIAAIKKASETGVITGALKLMGSKIISGVAGGTAGALGGGIPGALAGATAGEAVAFPFRAAADARQLGRANNVRRIVGRNMKVD